jgi:hypothetical protein
MVRVDGELAAVAEVPVLEVVPRRGVALQVAFERKANFETGFSLDRL